MMIAFLCLVSVLQATHEASSQSAKEAYLRRSGPRAMEMCLKVAQRAVEAQIDPLEVIAISFNETRHRDLISRAGARGPLQALPRYWSRRGDRDHIDAGIRAWTYYRARSKDIRTAAGKYNGAGKKSAYARDVETHYHLLQDARQWVQTR